MIQLAAAVSNTPIEGGIKVHEFVSIMILILCVLRLETLIKVN